MLDERESKAGAAERAAARDVDAIEALGQARKMLRGNSRAVIAHRDHGLGLAARAGAATA